jgi:signal transduction histidine kinase
MDALVAAAIHDAKNSLSALGDWLSEAQREFSTLAKKPSPALSRATAIANTLSGQLVELLALYRDGGGSLRLAVEDHHLEDFLTDLLAELAESRPVTQQGEDGNEVVNTIVIDTDFASTARVATWAFDAYLVKFALLDALRNALRHAREHVRFAFSPEKDGGIRFDIEDDGAGYPDAILSNENSAEMSSSGSGLGLSFARLIAARHATPGGRHGRLELANDGLSAGGARFSLVLP